MSYVNTKEASKIYGVTDQTLRRWASNNQISFILTKGGHRRYFIKDPIDGTRIIYARVSSSKQKADLQRQSTFLRKKFPDYELITDIGSGINFKRKGFLSILQRLFEGSVSEVVVASSDRFSRFNYDFFKWLFKQFG